MNDMSWIKSYLDVVLEDDDSETGGVSFSGETLFDFLLESCVGDEDISTPKELNALLKSCGIKPVCSDDSEKPDYDRLLWDILLQHRGHNVSIVSYGDQDDPMNVSLECEDCGMVLLDAEIYTICAREDV